ncbi:MAG TPA: hypothetical protein VGF38_18925 [Ktedonobacterales bacterium]|jgi:hypothetical protein
MSSSQMPHQRKYPLPSKGEAALAIGKSALSFIPLAGAPAAELLGLIVTPILDRRREDFLESIGVAIAMLEERVGNFRRDQLEWNESFATTATRAVWSALHTHQLEKRRALRNAVLNVAVGAAPDDDLQVLFLDAIDALTPSHLRLLALLKDPRAWLAAHDPQFSNMNGGLTSSVEAVVERAIPEWVNKRQFYGLLFDNLAARGLVQGTSAVFGTSMTLNGALSSRTTELGRQFLAFITSPIEGLDVDDGD